LDKAAYSIGLAKTGSAIETQALNVSRIPNEALAAKWRLSSKTAGVTTTLPQLIGTSKKIFVGFSLVVTHLL
jgi:hypothetical protein